MIKRIIDISEQSYLSLKNQQLLIEQNNEQVGQVPIEDLGMLILAHPAIVLTQRLIIACQQNNTVVIFCDDKHLPYSAILPIGEANKLHQKVLQQQLAITEPTRKRLWQQIVQQKINQQSATLQQAQKNHVYLDMLASKVKSGDSSNCEATAARYYWHALFGEAFTRDIDAEGINSLLNYGYAIIRAMVARAIFGAGLHPSIGLFHHNQYNALCLADDVIEPFRPWIDAIVYEISQTDASPELSQLYKANLLAITSQTVRYNEKSMPLMVCLHQLISDLKRCYNKEKMAINYPEKQ